MSVYEKLMLFWLLPSLAVFLINLSIERHDRGNLEGVRGDYLWQLLTLSFLWPLGLVVVIVYLVMASFENLFKERELFHGNSKRVSSVQRPND